MANSNVLWAHGEMVIERIGEGATQFHEFRTGNILRYSDGAISNVVKRARRFLRARGINDVHVRISAT